MKKLIIILWSCVVIGVVAVIVFFNLLASGSLGYIPTMEEIESPPNKFATEVFSEDGVVLRKFYKDNRTDASFDDLPKSLVDALIATEDARFHDHSGIDLRGLVRVAKGVVTSNKSAGGGSTISQQLAKNYFPRTNMSTAMDMLTTKFKEWVIAVRLEKCYTKEEIIAMYLTKFDFLNQAVGINSAAEVYFSTTPDKLELHQSAMLVGMAKNPSYFNPLRYPERVKDRRKVVLSQMEKYGYITKAVKDSVAELSLGLDVSKVDYKTSVATYFTEYLRTTLHSKKPDRDKYPSWQQQKFVEDSIEWETNPLYGWCYKNLKENGEPYDIYSDGLRIYSTINYEMQKSAEEAVVEHLSTDLQPRFTRYLSAFRNAPFSNDLTTKEVGNLIDMRIKQTERYRVAKLKKKSFSDIKKEFNVPTKMRVFTWGGEVDTIMTPTDSIKHYLSYLRSSMMSFDPRNGYVKAYVGGPNYKHFMYDMVRDGKRQVGSVVKPFLYTLAMQNGLTPCTETLNIEYSFNLPDGSIWKPSNAGDDRYGESVTLKWGLANSSNNISAWIMKSFGDGGPLAMKKIMQKMGIYSKIDAVPSMFLGTSEISLYEMVGGFGTFVNKGIYTKPIFVSRIEDRYGNILSTFSADQHEAIDSHTADMTLMLLKGVVDGGTAIRLRGGRSYGGIKAEMGGKTGTTQNHSDGWFMAVTPKLVTGVWTGADLRSIRFNSITYGQGANMALPVYARYIHKVYDAKIGYSEEDKFEFPENFEDEFDCGEKSEDENDMSNNDLFDFF